MCIQISPIEFFLVGHVTAGRAALETGCMPTPLQRDAVTVPYIARYPGTCKPHFWSTPKPM